jgi:hypothetical protein
MTGFLITDRGRAANDHLHLAGRCKHIAAPPAATTAPDRYADEQARSSRLPLVGSARRERGRGSALPVYDRSGEAERSSTDVVRKGLVKSVSVEVTA